MVFKVNCHSAFSNDSWYQLVVAPDTITRVFSEFCWNTFKGCFEEFLQKLFQEIFEYSNYFFRRSVQLFFLDIFQKLVQVLFRDNLRRFIPEFSKKYFSVFFFSKIRFKNSYFVRICIQEFIHNYSQVLLRKFSQGLFVELCINYPCSFLNHFASQIFKRLYKVTHQFILQQSFQ